MLCIVSNPQRKKLSTRHFSPRHAQVEDLSHSLTDSSQQLITIQPALDRPNHRYLYYLPFIQTKMNRFLLALLSALLIVSTSAFAPSVSSVRVPTQQFAIWDTVSSMYNNWGKKATASHILFKPSQFDEDAAKAKLTEMKAEIGDDPEKFAAAAKEWSGCPSSKDGGNLGEFGPGMMVKNFDDVCFNEKVGVVHGPISTQFGEHLILITSRTGEE